MVAFPIIVVQFISHFFADVPADKKRPYDAQATPEGKIHFSAHVRHTNRNRAWAYVPKQETNVNMRFLQFEAVPREICFISVQYHFPVVLANGNLRI